MSEREEVLKEFNDSPDFIGAIDSPYDHEAMADEIVRLRSQLAAEREARLRAQRWRDRWHAFASKAVTEANTAERALDEARRERDALKANFPWHRGDEGLPDVPVLQERYDALRHRAERMERVVEAVAGLAEVDVINGGEYYDDICVQPVLAAYHRYTLDTTPTRPQQPGPAPQVPRGSDE